MYIVFGKSYVADIINHDISKDKAKMSTTNKGKMEITSCSNEEDNKETKTKPTLCHVF